MLTQMFQSCYTKNKYCKSIDLNNLCITIFMPQKTKNQSSYFYQ